jgi:hypothetical protein
MLPYTRKWVWRAVTRELMLIQVAAMEWWALKLLIIN